MKEQALRYLERDAVLYMGLISPIKRDTADILYAGQDGVFLRERESGVYMIDVCNLGKGKELLDEIGKPVHICIYKKEIADYLNEKHGYKKYVENVQAAYMKAESVKLSSSGLEMQLLTLEQLEQVHAYYRDHLDYDYLKARILRSAIYGGFLNGELCGFAGMHTEGAIGILMVLEKFRGRGVAQELYGALVNIMLEKGDIPYAQIEYDNDASLGLHRKLGFEVSEGTLYRLIGSAV